MFIMEWKQNTVDRQQELAQAGTDKVVAGWPLGGRSVLIFFRHRYQIISLVSELTTSW